MDGLTQNSQLLIYQSPDGVIKIDVRLEDETVWLTQEQIAVLFGKGRSTITEHIGNIFKEGELTESMVCRNFRHTTQHGAMQGKTQEVSAKYYNLDIIISVGYRRSQVFYSRSFAVKFRMALGANLRRLLHPTAC